MIVFILFLAGCKPAAMTAQPTATAPRLAPTSTLAPTPNPGESMPAAESSDFGFPETIDPDRHYLFYLHGKIIEDQGIPAVSEEYGEYEFLAILEALQGHDLVVISEQRSKDTDGVSYAHHIVEQINLLLEAGVPAEQITVIGASKGAYIAATASNLLRNSKTNFVLIGFCATDTVEELNRNQVWLYGNILAIYDTADELAGSCQELFASSEGRGIGRHDEIVLHIGTGHGILYKPLDEWIQPAVEWARASSQTTPTASPTPLFEIDLSRYDPDIFPPIDVSHNPPLIARADEGVTLVFNTVHTFCMEFSINCRPDGVLYYTYGGSESFESIQLTYEIIDEMESLVTSLPATDPRGQSLRYYAEFTLPEVAYTQRYPTAGTIDLFTTTEFIPIELPVENPAQPGEVVYNFYWGYGEDKVLQATYPHYPQRVGPPAMDVARDGRIALMDPVNDRIIVFDPKEDSYTSLPMPFQYNFYGDIAFDPQGRIVVFDWTGEAMEGSTVAIPQAYRLRPDGEIDASTPVYVNSPANITRELKVLDYDDSRLVIPFNPQGEPNPRQVQREKETWEYPLRYVEGQDPYLAHYADLKEGAAFEVSSASPLGVLIDFGNTPQGYLLIFDIGVRWRAVWIDAGGQVLKDVTLPNGLYAETNFHGQSAMREDGSLYLMSSTKWGIEIHIVAAPEK